MRRLRIAFNRLVTVVALVFVLPAVAVAELLGRGRGGRFARTAILAVTPLLGVRIEVRGTERLDEKRSYVFAPTHSSGFDIPALLVARPTVAFAAAAELFRNPLLAAAMRALRTVAIDRARPETARQALTEAAKRLGPDSCLVIFPEGGLAPRGERRRFKSGPFVLAIQARVPVVPVAIHNAAAVFPPKSWLAIAPGRIVVEVLEPIPTDGYDLDDRQELRERTRAALLAVLRPEEGGTAARPDLGSF